MHDLDKELPAKNIRLPDNIASLLSACKSYQVFDTSDQLAEAATQGQARYEVTYDVPGNGTVLEAVVERVRNGISANYTEPYMRRRDPGTMAIADDKPTDKDRFVDKYGYAFDTFRKKPSTGWRNRIWRCSSTSRDARTSVLSASPSHRAMPRSLPWACQCCNRL